MAAMSGAGAAASLRIHAGAGGDDGKLALTISGVWPSSCVPALTEAKVSGADLTLLARPSGERCAARPSPFAFSIDPASEAGLETLAPGIYRVRVEIEAEAGALPTLAGFRLLSVSSSEPVFTPTAGFWWLDRGDGSEGSGNGLSIEVQGNAITAAVFSYDAHGKPEWRFGAGTLDGQVAHLDLFRFSGGGALAADARPPTQSLADAELALEFASANRGRAWLIERSPDSSLPRIATTQFPIVRIAFGAAAAPEGWRGLWLLAPHHSGSALETNRFEFVNAAQLDADAFRLTTAETRITLECRRRSGRNDALPEQCSLLDAHGTLARFSMVGTERMDGLGADGFPISLIRLRR